MNSAKARFLWVTRLRSVIGNEWCGSDPQTTSLQSIGNLCSQRLHDLASHDRMEGSSSTPLTLLQRDLEILINARTLHSKKEIVSFLTKAKTLLATSESFLSKEQLLSLLERVSQLGPSLETDQIKRWSLSFWTTMSYQLASIAKSCHICDISRILAVYILAFPRGVKGVKRSNNSNEQLFSKLMSVLDLRLRQTEDKSHLALGEMELKCVLSIFSSVADLNSCSISTPLIRRLLARMTSNPQLWTEDHILMMLDCLERLKYVDQYSKFSAFVVNKLSRKEMIDQHKLCQIIKGLSLLRPKFISSQKLNSILWSSLSNFEELRNEELVDLMSSLAKLKVIVEDEALRLLLGHLFLRTSACTPSQLSCIIFSLSTLPKTSVKSQICSAAAIELTKRVRCFNANDLARITFGFCRLHFHPQEECISKVISHSLDILLEDEIIQSSDAVLSVESYNQIEYSTKMQGMIARAQLDDLRKPFHFTNRTKLKQLKNAIATEQCPENLSNQKQQYDNFKGYELAALVFALAQMQIESVGDKFFDFVKEEIMRETISLDVFELTFALWGIALSGHLDKRLLLFAFEKIKEDDEKDKHQIKIRMAKSILTLVTLNPSKEMIDLQSIPYFRDCYKLWLEQECSLSVVSPIIHEAMQLLRKSGFDCELRCQLNHRMCVADVVRGVNGQTFALEVRPVSFDSVENHIPGESRWRLKILEAAGCTVLYIKSMVWERMDENEKIEYLKRLTGML